jgi:phage tail-like protein
MADNVTAQGANTQEWPLPSFYFKVSISNVGDISCSEVSGLETEYEEITYRAGDSPVFTKLKMPGLRKSGDLTIKKGIFKDDKALWDWVNKVKLNTIQREVVTVSLLDESGTPVKTWEAVNAWPKKLTVEDFKADGNTTAFETLVIAHEGVSVK